MRTVHETEALRPSDPVPKSMSQPMGKTKLKLILKTSNTPQSHPSGANSTADDGDASDADTDDQHPHTRLTDELGFTDAERAMPVDKLYRRCKLWHRLAEREAKELEDEWRELERRYKAEWLEKEVLLDQVINSELDWNKRRRTVLADMSAEQQHASPAVAGPRSLPGDENEA